jgi:site-specific DNA recombinase
MFGKFWGITDSTYTKFFTHLKEDEAQGDTKLLALQNAQDNYYITANYILELSKRAYKLILSSEMEDRRQLLKLVFQNLNIDGKKVCIVAQKPFDTIFKCANSLSWGG